MYRIIGDDKREYGPVSVEQIGHWIREGRVNQLTKVQVQGSGEWRPLSEFPELAGLLKANAPVPPVPPIATASASKTSGFAIASLVLAVLGFCSFGLTAIVGLILGIVALVKISRSNGALKGQGLAMAGTILSGVLLLMLPVFAGLLLPALAKAKSKAMAVRCMNNMRQLAMGARIYADDNNDLLPSAANWCDALQKYVAKADILQCPLGERSRHCHYGFNAQLSGIELSKIESPAQTVLFFEIDGGWNVSGGSERALKQARHPRIVGVAFADGHVELVNPSRLQKLVWKP